MARLNLGGCARPAIAAALLTGCGGSIALPVEPMTSAFTSPLSGSGFETIYSFRPKLQEPSGLTAVNGVLYGTASAAGFTNYGSVFALEPSGKVHVLHIFRGGSDGAYPTAGLIVVNGVLYGTTAHGGTGWRHNKQCQTGPPPSGGEGCGTVFSITTSGEVRVLHSFKGGSDGNFPFAGLTLLNGKLYGVTLVGGTRHPCGQYIGTGCGTVFEVSTSGEERIVYRFRGGKDGAAPEGTLLALDGKLFGTTYSGGDKTCDRSRCGTLFDVTASGGEEVLYRFKGGTDGGNPSAGVISAGGALYGTTNGGGTGCYGYGCGTIFKATTSGKETVLYSFKGPPDGAYPTSRLTSANGSFYGVTPAGGEQCDAPSGPYSGTVYKLTGSGTEKVVHRFSCHAYSRNGIEPAAPLVYLAHALYGTTTTGGRHNSGTAFALNL
ncbi:MAG: choice-of-anchor tandem repeat GloVer-containing protein [Candidatus Cybelea sp.]